MGTRTTTPNQKAEIIPKYRQKKILAIFWSVGIFRNLLTKYGIGSIIDLSFIRGNSDASKSRNGTVDLMLELLFYSTLTCQQTDAIILRMQKNGNISNSLKIELVEVMKESNPECYWDAHD